VTGQVVEVISCYEAGPGGRTSRAALTAERHQAAIRLADLKVQEANIIVKAATSRGWTKTARPPEPSAFAEVSQSSSR
jgi:hypothetical protein